MAGRLYEWIVVGAEGGYSSDNFVFFFLLALLTCGVAIYSAWALYRYHNALVAVLPVGLVLFINSFLSARGTTWLIIFVVATLILLMAAHLASLQHKWKKNDIDYSAELNFDLTFFAVQVSAVLAVLALVMPTLRANPVASTWWIYASRPWGEVETTFNRMFAGVNNPNPDLGTGSKGALVLGGSFEPAESSPIYMYVKTNEYVLPPEEAERTGEPGLGPPAHYWRGETWDYYTGRGWDHSNKAAVDRAANQRTIDYDIQGAQELRQEVEIMSPRADIMFGANQIVTVTQPYRYLGVGPEDFATLYLKRAPLAATTYVISSEVPYLGTTDLRRASTDYAEWVQTYYLEVPKNMPQRVTDLAKQITADAVTPYDKAIAIQDYLRKLPYDPAIKLPQGGNYDAVDYFLFIQKGYCDYFGTVMAIMLRSVGVPARLATGYLPGNYDYVRQRYEVSERDGHAWTEVYFPPYGWINFEPTPGKAPVTYPEGSILNREPFVMPNLPAIVVKKSLFDIDIPFDLSFLRIVPIILLAAVALGLLWALWPLLERRQSTPQYIATIYNRMLRYAQWAGLTKPQSATPYEYSRSLGTAVSGAASGAGRRGKATGPAVDPASYVGSISQAYVQTRYSQHPPTDETRQSVMDAWHAVKGHIWGMVARGSARRLLRRK